MQLIRRNRPAPGSAPGSLDHITDAPRTPLRVSVMDYRHDELEEHDNLTIAEAQPYFSSTRKTWIHVQGDPGPDELRAVGEAYGLHPLAVEDVINGGQRTKLEEYPRQKFVVLRHPVLVDDVLETEQVSIFLGDSFIVSFHGGETDIFAPVRERLRENPLGRLRKLECDYLLYALIDLVVDHSFPVLESIGEQLEALEDRVLNDPTRGILDQIHLMKRELILLRRAQWPQREMLNSLLRDEHEFIQESTKVYLRDCYDHTIQVMDLIENYREMSSGLLEVYLSSLSNRMNDTMRVLTVIATIFIPLSFVAGVYGMNFDTSASKWNMPELAWPFGYLMFWLFTIGIAGAMLVVFRRKGWF